MEYGLRKTGNKKPTPRLSLRGFLMLILVCRVRQKSAESCSLDSLGQLTLMISTGAGDTAGQDLCTLGHALSELSGILIINSFSSVNTEHTNLFTRPLGRSVSSLHDNSPFR